VGFSSLLFDGGGGQQMRRGGERHFWKARFNAFSTCEVVTQWFLWEFYDWVSFRFGAWQQCRCHWLVGFLVDFGFLDFR
jgi:hypothetical protein